MARGVILLAIVCLFLSRMFAQQQSFTVMEKLPEGQSVMVSGRVCKKEWKGDGCVYYLRDVSIQDASVKYPSKHDTCTKDSSPKEYHPDKIIVRMLSCEYPIGAYIQLTCKMRYLEKASNTGGYDERQYYHSLGVAAVLYGDSLPVILDQPRRCLIRNGLFSLRQRMREVYQEQLNDKDAGVLSSMVLGDKSLMEEEIKQLYNAAGISHILAVSGLHVSIIGMTLFQFLRKRGCRYEVSCLVSGIVLMLFCIMSGLSVSALRAGIMFLIYLGAQVLGRKYQSLRGLMAAAMITLLMNPSYLYNAGFLFSYFAVLGAVVITPIWRERIVVKSIALSGSILLTTLPLTAFYYYEIPIYSLLANLIVIPLAGVVMGFGLLGGFAGVLWNLMAGALPVLTVNPTWILFIPCHFILRLYEAICTGLGFLPADVWITGRPPMPFLFVYYGLLGAVVIVLRKKGTHATKKETHTTKKIPINKMIYVMPIALLIIMFTLPASKQCQISFLDVGQGDGIYINGGEGAHFFVDGGSTSEKELGRYTILPFLKYHRVRQIDVWFVSHADTDHVSGLLEVLEVHYPVDTIVLSEFAPEDKNLLELVNAARKNHTDVVFVSNNTIIERGQYTITCYTPQSADATERNETSLVLKVESSLSILLTGDIAKEQEEWLLSQIDVCDIDVLKAAHHGSKYSNSADFLQRIQPKLTIISCGENNMYGHPHSEALERIKMAGSQVLLTMEVGEITIYP